MSDFLDLESGDSILLESGDELLLESVTEVGPEHGCSIDQESGFSLLLESGEYLLLEDCVPEAPETPAETRPGGRLPLNRRGPYWDDEGPEIDAHRLHLLRDDEDLLVLT